MATSLAERNFNEILGIFSNSPVTPLARSRIVFDLAELAENNPEDLRDVVNEVLLRGKSSAGDPTINETAIAMGASKQIREILASSSEPSFAQVMLGLLETMSRAGELDSRDREDIKRQLFDFSR